MNETKVDTPAKKSFVTNIEYAAQAVGNPASMRGLFAVIGGLLVLLLPQVSSALLQLILIVGLTLSAGSDVVYAIIGRRRFGKRGNRFLAFLRALATVVFLLLLLAAPYISNEGGEIRLSMVVAIVGLYVMVRGLIIVIHALGHKEATHRGIRITGGIAAICIGGLANAAPEPTTNTLIAGGAACAIVGGLVLVAWGFRLVETGNTKIDPRTASLPEVLWDWIRGSNVGNKRREELADTLYFENPGKFDKMSSWWIMLVLSVAIATFAVLADSTAVVIGAMLVAPLMVPILGLAGALVNGWSRRALQSALFVASGVVVSILLSYAFAAWVPVATALDTNSQITSRVTPTLLDMLIAVAAGAAGAFATVNSRVSASIAGVAIAVALVPPLAVVGVTLRAGNTDDAAGAFLLFLTNFVAIVIVAAVVFVLSGFARPRALRENPTKMIITVVPFIALAAVILLPLMLTSEGIVSSATKQRDAQAVVTDWVGDTEDLLVQDVTISDEEVTVSLIGSGDTPAVDQLQQALFEKLGNEVSVTVILTPVTTTHLPIPTG
ncbi:DUF389 domain-containing protein [Demequina oxidasica]|uniref:DUF389 domain-containing protein n=1 Tax=Demequina oxidasica TaxID=676199 RepID=UPI0007864A4E|nr:DUF389 domain-containing protein [Demequina oxidasica]